MSTTEVVINKARLTKEAAVAETDRLMEEAREKLKSNRNFLLAASSRITSPDSIQAHITGENSDAETVYFHSAPYNYVVSYTAQYSPNRDVQQLTVERRMPGSPKIEQVVLTRIDYRNPPESHGGVMYLHQEFGHRNVSTPEAVSQAREFIQGI